MEVETASPVIARRKRERVAPLKNSVEYWAVESGISARSLWRMIAMGELRAVKVGCRTVVTAEAWAAFMGSRPVAGGVR